MDIKLKNNPKLNKLGQTTYTKLEYIESSGTQWIDTGFKPNQNTKVVLDCMLLTTRGEGRLFGAADAWNSNWIGIESGELTRLFYGSKYVSVSITRYKRLYIEFDKNVVKIDNSVIKTFTEETWQTTSENLKINAMFDISAYIGTNRFYGVKIYDNGTLIRDFIPALDNNNVVCMYETVSETFYYNQGSGNFIAGGIIYENPIFQKVTTIYHNNCTNINGFIILKSIKLAQESLPSAQKLNRVRVDIGSVAGSLSELMQYSTLAGFNDDYQQQTKPRLVGTWTINNYYTASQLSAARAAFDGLTIVENQNYLLDFSQMAVQTLNPNEDNYNPAVAIILQGQNKGTLMDSAQFGYGRWFLTKTQASSITSIANWFRNKTTVTDQYGIVSSDTSASYYFNSFNELQFFNITGFNNGCFQGCTSLESITIPDGVNTLSEDCFNGCTSLQSFNFHSNIKNINSACFLNCRNLKLQSLPTSIENIGYQGFARVGQNLTLQDSELIDLNLPNLSTIGYNCFTFCKCIKSITSLGSVAQIPYACFESCSNIITVNIHSGVTELRSNAFKDVKSNCIIHFFATTPPTIPSDGNTITPNTVKVYVGDGSSAANDNAILQAYLADTNWATYIGSSRLDTWYNYLHPTA